MTGEDEPTDPIVSIQDARGEDAVAGHLAWGELITPRLVAVRGSTGWASEPVRFEVLIASPHAAAGSGADPNADSPLSVPAQVERIKPLRIEIIPAADDGSARGALVWLAQSSKLPAPYSESLGTLDPSARETGEDLRTPVPAWDAAEILAPIAILEEELRQVLVRPWEGPADDRSRMWWCFIFGGC